MYFLLSTLVRNTDSVWRILLARRSSHHRWEVRHQHPAHKNPSERPQRPPRELHARTDVSFAPGMPVSVTSSNKEPQSPGDSLTCRLNVSSGLNASNRACSWPLLGGRRKNSLQNPSDGSKSSVAYSPVSTWHRANKQETYFEEGLVELDDLRLKGLGSTLLGEGRGLHGARRRMIGNRSHHAIRYYCNGQWQESSRMVLWRVQH